VRRHVSRRSAAGLLALGPALGVLAGCGFRLRGATALPFASLRLGFDALSPMGQELRRQLMAVPDLRLVSGTTPAEAVLDVLEDSFTRTVSSRTAAGQVRELSLTARLRFRLRTAEGDEWLRETMIVQNQLMSYNETAALAKESEEAQLARSMREDIAAQVVRRLAALKR
jgi:LPS-assembly lipoprotein